MTAMNDSLRGLFRFAAFGLVAFTIGCSARDARSTGGSASSKGASVPASRPQLTGPAEAARAGFLAVVAAKRDLLAKCWAPLVAKQPTPARSKHVLRETFGADGAEAHREVTDVAGESRADVGSCLRDLPLDLKSKPSDFPSTVEVTLAFP
jgi:hypothetical protein